MNCGQTFTYIFCIQVSRTYVKHGKAHTHIAIIYIYIYIDIYICVYIYMKEQPFGSI